MEFILIIGIVLIVLLLNSHKNRLESRFDSMQANFDNLFNEIRRIETLAKGNETEKLDVSSEIRPFFEIIKAEQEAEIIEQQSVLEVQNIAETIQQELVSGPEFEAVAEPEPAVGFEKIEQEPESSFWQRNPDLERFIGENLINKIGIAILVLGMGFFLKYAIDQNWINEIGRTFIGLFTGGILIGIAHRMRHAYRSFSSVLIGGGIAILYFAITIAYQQYNLFGQEVAFVIMVFITAATVFLSISYDRLELAVLAIVGGFCAPFLVSSGEGNYVVLFSYLLILNVGMLVLAYYKKWNLINQICFVLTMLLFGGWVCTKIVNMNVTEPKPYWGALRFAVLFYFVFFVMNVINNIKEKVAFKELEIVQLLSNTAVCFAAGILILGQVQDGIYRGTFTIFMAAVNFLFAFFLYKNNRVDRNLLYLLIGLVLTFVSLAAPIQLEGNYITLFWACESVLLVWLAHKSGIHFLREASAILVVLLIISLLLDWKNIYLDPEPIKNGSHLFPFLNKGFVTSVVAIGGLLAYITLMKRYFLSGKLITQDVSIYLDVLSVAAVILTYFGIILELHYQAEIYFPATRIIILGCYNYIWSLLLVYFSRNLRWEVQFATLLYAAVMVVAFAVYNKETIWIRENYLLRSGSRLSFLSHYILTFLSLANLYFISVFCKGFAERFKMKKAFQWITIVAIVYAASAELDHIMVASYWNPHVSVDEILTANHKAGFAILWGICSFILIYLGMKWKSKTIRIASLALFGLALLKLFIVDIRGLSEGGKIGAFISLGVLLLVISFMYQRLKILLLEDELKADITSENPEIQ
ncbi:DUF2339 domain-containing protein [Dyadobacter subterraneus]|uniref:DUF2339 domain-containing protein n=1 Tax=Dyadobacter subterraneus TaxID=2773304 RepID=A0ABR9WDL7_9BACT|nr:DUF2339 domain-containing protein [Dyadobacter subterraneus]MBE9463587.1 DUF2339 domain-containing protein [Dyadobacter subterraneus]